MRKALREDKPSVSYRMNYLVKQKLVSSKSYTVMQKHAPITTFRKGETDPHVVRPKSKVTIKRYNLTDAGKDQVHKIKQTQAIR